MCESSADVIKPLILGCETKQPKIIQISLTSVQKVIEAKILNVSSASLLINTLWQLTDANLEELKVLQTIILLVTTTDVVKHELLAKVLTIGLRIAASKDPIVMNTATAMLNQMVTKVFERAQVETSKNLTVAKLSTPKDIDIDKLKSLSKEAPSWMSETAQDAYMLLQDIYLLLNSDQSLWLININDINKPFGLELLKSVLSRYTELFQTNPEMLFILKERICPLLIKLFSPSTKLKMNTSTMSFTSNSSLSSNATTQQANSNNSAANDQRNFGIVSRLVRIVFILIKNYFELLVTESEIFLSLLAKFLESDRPVWQKALAIEVFQKVSVETNLIESIVLNYDMKQHPEKIFQLITNGVSLFIQSLFVNAATHSNSSNSTSANNSTTSTSNSQSAQNAQQANGTQQAFAFQISSAQPSFVYKETTIQLLFPYVVGQVKSLYLDTWDKLDIPYIQDGYLLSVAFATLQELCKSVQTLVEKNILAYQQQAGDAKLNAISLKRLAISDEQISSSKHLSECMQIMSSCANSFLFIYNLLLESSLDETITEQIIKSIKSFIYMLSLLNLSAQRDAFVTSLCKAALPVTYAHNVLNLKAINELNNKQVSSKQPIDDSADKQIQVVAIGPALYTTTSSSSPLLASSSSSSPSTSSSSSNQTLCITAKNLLTMKTILNMSHVYAELIGESSWYIILNTMQHLAWTLALKPTSNGQLKHTTSTMLPTSQANDSNSMITTAIQTEIAFMCNMLSKLFETTRTVSDQALNEMIDALLKLSIESSDLAYLKNEPTLFALAKLYETCVSNLNRIELFWTRVTMHFLCSCKHSNIKYREWSVDSVCNLIRATFNHKYTTNSMSNIDNDTILKPLSELSTISYNDIRQKQIECTLSLLRLLGQHLNDSWPICLNIIGAIQREHTEVLIRSAFQCLQLVVTDFLSMIKSCYLSLVINVVSQFGSQEQDLNISLTAIVLLWNISDYMFQHTDSLNENAKTTNDKIESIWMVLYSRLGDLCVDARPAVRKSACQTLFCTISSHGSVLSVDLHWKELVWNVLFPLLEKVQHLTSTASRERDKNAQNPNFLMHHSRDTAEKQWAETSVLTLSGVTRVFNSKCWILIKLPSDEFQRMWLFLLNMIQKFALSKNAEISLAALRGFHELLGNQNYFSSSFTSNSGNSAQTVAAAAAAAASAVVTNSNSAQKDANKSDSLSRKKVDDNSNISNIVKTLEITQWVSAWKTWLDIGHSIMNSNFSTGSNWPPPSQTFLTCYIDLVSVIVDKLAAHCKFTDADFEIFSQIVNKILSLPVINSDYSASILMSIENNLTPLQNSSLSTMKNFIKLLKTADSSFQTMFVSLIFHRLLSFLLYACYTNNQINPATSAASPTLSNGSSVDKNNSLFRNNEIVSINYVPFGEKALVILTHLYDEWASHESVIEHSILKSIIQALYVPLSLKYSCPNASTWKLSIECLFKILKRALPIAYKNKQAFETMWQDLAKTFEDFLFTKNVSNAELSIEALQKDEFIDCQLIELIRDDILTHANLLPQSFLQKILAILNRGSIYSNNFDNFLDLESTRKLREEFSKTCFETLLRFSFVNENQTNGPNHTNLYDTNLTRMALTSMLNRCKDIIQKYVHDEKLSGTIPLPRY
jgi:hypothetical protein